MRLKIWRKGSFELIILQALEQAHELFSFSLLFPVLVYIVAHMANRNATINKLV